MSYEPRSAKNPGPATSDDELRDGYLDNIRAAGLSEANWRQRYDALRRDIDGGASDPRMQAERVAAWASVCRYIAERTHWGGYLARLNAHRPAPNWPDREPGSDDDLP
jgi:hypothetical protein